jgi:hypothetical protein
MREICSARCYPNVTQVDTQANVRANTPSGASNPALSHCDKKVPNRPGLSSVFINLSHWESLAPFSQALNILCQIKFHQSVN